MAATSIYRTYITIITMDRIEAPVVSGERERALPLRELDTSEIRPQIRQEYLTNALLAYKIGKALQGRAVSADEQFELEAIERNKVADGVVLEKDGVRLSGEDVARINLERMERATAAKWFCTIEEMMRAGRVDALSTTSEYGRLQIAIPGAHYGLEIGGILDWCNQQGISIDVTAIDHRLVGGVGNFLRLDDRSKPMGSTVEYVQAGVEEFYPGKRTDLVVLRHPGPIASLEQQNRWRRIIAILADTDPRFIIVSTYNYPILDPVAAGRPDGTVTEGELLRKWIEGVGYIMVPGSVVENDELEYPVNLYGIPRTEGAERITRRAVDRRMSLFRKKY